MACRQPGDPAQSGHGTHVAGTIGGTTYGLAKNVSVVAVRVLDCSGSGLVSQVVAGVDWVTAHAIKPAVANLSLGGGTSATMDSAVSNSIAVGRHVRDRSREQRPRRMYVEPGRRPCGADRRRAPRPQTAATRRTRTSDPASTSSLPVPASPRTGTPVTPTRPSSVARRWPRPMSLASSPGTSRRTHVPPPRPSPAPSWGDATLNKVTNAGTGSPNRLLYSGFLGPNVRRPPTVHRPQRHAHRRLQHRPPRLDDPV